MTYFVWIPCVGQQRDEAARIPNDFNHRSAMRTYMRSLQSEYLEEILEVQGDSIEVFTSRGRDGIPYRAEVKISKEWTFSLSEKKDG